MARILSSRIFTSSLLVIRLFSRSEHAGDMRDELARELELGAAAEVVLAAVVVQPDRVLVASQRILREVRGEKRDSLARTLLHCVPRQVFALRGEADAERGVLHAGDRRQDVRVLFQLDG